jgi:hypothetical protein
MSVRNVLGRSLVAFTGLCAIPALGAAIPEPPGLKALFTFDVGTGEIDGPTNYMYSSVVNRFAERPWIIFVGGPPTNGGYGPDFVDFEGVSHPGGYSYGLSGPDPSSRQMILQFHPSDGAGYEISFDYRSTARGNAHVATRYAGDFDFTPVGEQPFIPDGQWHRATRDMFSLQDRTLQLGFTFDPTTAADSIAFDNFQIVALPEPGVAGLSILSATVLLPRRRL